MLWGHVHLRTFEPEGQLRRQCIHRWRPARHASGIVQRCGCVCLQQGHGLCMKMREPRVDGDEHGEELPFCLPSWIASGCLENSEIMLGPVLGNPCYRLAVLEQDCTHAEW